MGNKLQKVCCRTYSVDIVHDSVTQREAFTEIPVENNKPSKNDPVLVSRKQINTNEFVPLEIQLVAACRVNTQHQSVCVVSEEPKKLDSILNVFNREKLEEIYENYMVLDSFKLDLNSAMIDWIDPNTFAAITNITDIDLSENNLKHISGQLFKGLVNLKVVNLSRNKLKNLDVNLFSGLVSLEVVDLSFNELEDLNMKLFDGLISLKKIVLNGNNWKVDNNNNNQMSISETKQRRNSHIYYFFNPIDLQSIADDVDIRFYDFVTKIDDSLLNK